MQSDAIMAKLTGCFSQKQAVLNLLDQKYHAFEHALPVRFQEPNQDLHTLGDDMIPSDMRNKDWLPEVIQLILHRSHGTSASSEAFWECYGLAETWSLSLSRSWRLAAGHAKGKSALALKPAQPALFQNMMENALLCSAFLLSVEA